MGPGPVIGVEQAGMIGQLRDDTGGIRGLGKVEKVYLEIRTWPISLGMRVLILAIFARHSSITKCVSRQMSSVRASVTSK